MSVSLYSYFGKNCFHHLGKVISGIDSAILGESDIQRQVKHKHPKSYLQHAPTAERIVETRVLGEDDVLFEFLLNHLRIKQPISWQRFSARTGMSADTLKTLFTEQVAEDWYFLDDQGVCLTDAGFLMSDEILQKLL